MSDDAPPGAGAGSALLRPHGDPAVEDRALHEGAAVFDRRDRGRLSLTGPKAAELLTGLVTNDVLALAPGQGQYAAMLTPKGKILADLRIFALPGTPVADANPALAGRFLVDTAARAADNLLGTIRKYVNPRLAPYRDERTSLAHLTVGGPRASAMVAAATGVDVERIDALPPYGHLDAGVEDTTTMVARTPELLVPAWDLFLPASQAPALVAQLGRAGAVCAGPDTWDVARVEAGRPEWGLDIDDATIPQEANFDELGAISYVKGCYTGQETVARVHFRGHVNRHLRHLRFPAGEPAPRGATLADESGKPVGDVRSGAVSPRTGAIAIAMVRREVAPGSRVIARWEGGEAEATVASLPCVVPGAA